MDKAYLDLALSEMKWLLSIPSPSGFTMEISEKLVARLKEMGFEPRQSLKGAVTALLGGEGRPGARHKAQRPAEGGPCGGP